MTRGGYKKEVRDIQHRTGWKYQYTKRIVDEFGYDVVSNVLDDASEVGTSFADVGAEFGRLLREKARARGDSP